ncbi:MAG: acetyltransferase [Bacteroidia bacterium]|nr:acetyltransferase [Bacteroidia bacterium]NND51909.1 acetyltransferase [Flavobacteriaceae bacterium]
MKDVIIFGINDFAELAHYYLENDSDHSVTAFCVHEQYLPENTEFKGLPVVAFENVDSIYSPSNYSFFAPMSPSKMNSLRQKVYEAAKQKGYNFISYISSKATLFDNQIGENCFILEDNTIQPFTSIGNNVVLWSGNHIGHHCVIKDHVMFTSHVVLSGHCVVESNCFFGVNATIRDGLTIAEGSLIAMAASITQDTEPWSAYVGNPQKKLSKPSMEIDI